MSIQPDKPFQIFFLSSTHWDREWYQPFQAMRFRLAETLDELLEVMEAQKDFSLFCLDGQTVVLEDYLEAAPENRARLQRLIREGRVKIGPWYVMPDTRLVSGESLIANFLMGERVCRRWGVEPWHYGYMCDIFGHIAQMPQLLTGFHMDGAYLGRGLCEDWSGLFQWQSPDGTDITACFSGYSGFTTGITNHYSEPDYEERLRSHIDQKLQATDVPVIILVDGADHARINPHTNQILADIRRLYPAAQVRHETLEHVASAAQGYEMPHVCGELISTTRDRRVSMRLVGQSMSSHYPVKYRNDRCQNLMERAVQPLAAVARLLGMKYRPALMEKAMDYLLKNHPHDSICGCSVDQVHIDMRYRFDQAEAIGREMIARSCAVLWQEAGTGDPCIQIVNPLTRDVELPLRLKLPLPKEYPARHAESSGYGVRDCFRLFDKAGHEVPYELRGIQKDAFVRVDRQSTRPVDLYDVVLKTRLPALGTASLSVQPAETVVRYDRGPFAVGPDYCDNGLLRVDIAPDGTLTLADHQTGQVYAGLNRFADDGEEGNGWFHDAPVGDRVRFSGAPVRVERLSAGPVSASFEVEQRLRLPKSLSDREQTELVIHTTLTLYAGERCLRVDVEVQNTATDHRLRVLMPTGVKNGQYTAGQAFCFVERPSGLSKERLDWDEQESLEKSMNGILYTKEGNRGLAFVSPFGLHEGGVDTDGTLSVTMLRSFSFFHMSEEPMIESRLLGSHRFRYAIVPLDEASPNAQLVRLQEEMDLHTPIRWCDGAAPGSASLLNLLSDQLLVSLVKPPEDGEEDALIIRLWNPTDAPQSGRLDTCLHLTGVEETALDEVRISGAPFDEHGFDVELPPWKIQTYRLRMKTKGECP